MPNVPFFRWYNNAANGYQNIKVKGPAVYKLPAPVGFQTVMVTSLLMMLLLNFPSAFTRYPL